jgi:transmembrane sensor
MMKHIPENILALIEKYNACTANAEEKNIINEWYLSFDDTAVSVDVNEIYAKKQLEERIRMRLHNTIENEEVIFHSKQKRRWIFPAVAAALIFAIGLFIFFPSKKTVTPKIISKNNTTKPSNINDIKPGGNKAMLTLADGSTIVLDSASNGTLGQQGNIKIIKLDNGLLAYTVNGKQLTENDEAFFNTISTPRGGQYQVTLADGTMVWLNAASSIRFPAVFTGTQRKVEITGEVYFEVAKNKEMPFKVKATSSEIEVLGTHFNVNAYSDEANIKTTLLEGSVKISATSFVSNTQTTKTLLPGQQASNNNDGKIKIINNADLEETMAWKNGRFQFKSTDLKSILRQIARWYDVDVEYKGNVDLHFTGQLTRNENVSKVFEKLALTNEVHFKIEGKRIIVSP